MVRREFELSEDQLAKLKEIASQPYIVIGGLPPRSPQQRANEMWAAFGRDMGFDSPSVQPVPGKGERFFTAIAIEKEEPVPCGTGRWRRMLDTEAEVIVAMQQRNRAAVHSVKGVQAALQNEVALTERRVRNGVPLDAEAVLRGLRHWAQVLALTAEDMQRDVRG